MTREGLTTHQPSGGWITLFLLLWNQDGPNSRKSVSAITLISSSMCMFFLVGNQAFALTRVGLEHSICFHCYKSDVIEN